MKLVFKSVTENKDTYTHLYVNNFTESLSQENLNFQIIIFKNN